MIDDPRRDVASRRVDASPARITDLRSSSRCHQSSSVFASMFGTNKHEDAAELFEPRRSVQTAKLWSRAADSADCLAEVERKRRDAQYASVRGGGEYARKCENTSRRRAISVGGAAYAELRFSQRKHLKEVRRRMNRSEGG